MYYHDIDPVLLQWGPLRLYWYGLLYLLTLLVVWGLARWQTRFLLSGWYREEVDNLILYTAVGMLLGSRLGWFLFFQPQQLWQDPLALLRVWEGGMSFHGGLLGGLLSSHWVGRYYHKHPFQVTDFLSPLIPVGLFFVAIANFINGELWGKVTTLPWGVVFQKADLEPRHPVQLYEALSQGPLLWALFWWQVRQVPPRMALTGIFILAYGLLRVFSELFREPDIAGGYIAWGWLTMGQVLSLPMVAAGATMIILAYQKKEATS